MKWFILLSVFATTALALDSVPLFIWGNLGSKSSVPALSHYSTSEFSRFLVENTSGDKRVPIVAFAIPKLAVEDFKTCNGCFKNLQSYKPDVYFTSVTNPISSISTLNQLQASDTKILLITKETWKAAAQHVKKSIESRSSENFLITFGDNSDIAECDKMMGDFQRELGEQKDTIFIYTAETSRQIRNRVARQAPAATSNETKVEVKPRQEAVNNGHFFNVNGRLLIYYKRLVQIVGENQNEIEVTALPTVTALENGAFNATIRGTGANQVIEMRFQTSAGYWSVAGLAFNSIGLFVNDDNRIGTPLGFSYVCSDNLKYHGSESSAGLIIWEGLQIEPTFKETPDLEKFGDSWNCVGFTSPGILGGLFVVIMLLGILSIGIVCMMSINTNDRFDDPKGKTIIVNTGE